MVRFGFGRRLAAAGPFEVFDLAGLDTILAVAAQILPALATDEPQLLTGSGASAQEGPSREISVSRRAAGSMSGPSRRSRS